MIKNYSTTVSASKTIAEIELLLVKGGAIGINKEYDIEGNIHSLIFSIKTAHGVIGFKLPCELKKLHKRLLTLKKEQKIKISWEKLKNNTHALNVGWRIIKDWVHSQLSLIEIGMVTLVEIFLPYAYDTVKQQTLYETLKEDSFKLLKEPKQ